MRPMIAVSVLSATVFSSLIGLPLRIAGDEVGVLLHVRVDLVLASRRTVHALRAGDLVVVAPGTCPWCRPAPRRRCCRSPGSAGTCSSRARRSRTRSRSRSDRRCGRTPGSVRTWRPPMPTRLDRVRVHRPVDDVDVVDVLLDDVVAAEPGEVVPVAHLPLDVGPLRLAVRGSRARPGSSSSAPPTMSPMAPSWMRFIVSR